MSDLLAASVHGGVALWEVSKDGAVEKRLLPAKGTVLAVAFSPSADVVAFGGHDETVTFCSTRNNSVDNSNMCNKLELGARVRAVAFFPCSTKIAVLAAGSQVRLFDVRTGNEFALLVGHTSAAHRISIAPCGRFVANCGSDGKVCIWGDLDLISSTRPDRVVTGRMAMLRPESTPCYPPCIAWVPDSAAGQILVGADDATFLWNPALGNRRQPLCAASGGGGVVNAVAATTQFVASGGNSIPLRLWSLEAKTSSCSYHHHCTVWLKGDVSSLCFNADGTKLAVGIARNLINIVDVASGASVIEFDPKRVIFNVVCAPLFVEVSGGDGDDNDDETGQVVQDV